MGTVYNTTDHINTTMLHKSKLTKNFESDNYWIQSYQNKINQAWRYATDVVDIQEETVRYDDDHCVVANTLYHPLEVRINAAYDIKGQKLSDDYKNILFKDIEHSCRLGQKMLFNVQNFKESDNNNKSTWLTINFDTNKLGTNSIIRRCNAMTGMLINGNTQEWYEPTIIDFNPTYTINYLNDVLNVVKSELYAILQFNEYTKNIKINDRFIYGALDFDNLSNNMMYKVKEIFKLGTLKTEQPNDVPLLMLSLERDIVNVQNDYIAKNDTGTHYIADYFILKKDSNKQPDPPAQGSKYLQLTPIVDKIYQNTTQEFVVGVYENGQLNSTANIIVECSLPNCPNPSIYYKYTQIDNNHFTIQCKKKYFKQNLNIKISSLDYPDLGELSYSILLDSPLGG